MASSTPSTPHRASCRTADFREAVQRQRARLSLPTPASDILPRAKRKSAFTADSLSCLQEVGAMHAVLRESHAAYVLDEALGGMAEAERDGVDAETQRCLKASTAHARTHSQSPPSRAMHPTATPPQGRRRTHAAPPDDASHTRTYTHLPKASNARIDALKQQAVAAATGERSEQLQAHPGPAPNPNPDPNLTGILALALART